MEQSAQGQDDDEQCQKSFHINLLRPGGSRLGSALIISEKARANPSGGFESFLRIRGIVLAGPIG
jgi:hypothetical protein